MLFFFFLFPISHGGVDDAGWTSEGASSYPARLIFSLPSWIIYVCHWAKLLAFEKHFFSLSFSLSGWKCIYHCIIRSTSFRCCCIYFKSGFESVPDLYLHEFSLFLLFFFSRKFFFETMQRSKSHEIFMDAWFVDLFFDRFLERIRIFLRGFISSSRSL